MGVFLKPRDGAREDAQTIDEASKVEAGLADSLLFDQFSRYGDVARALRSLMAAASKGTSSPKILDVGCGQSCLLGRFLPEAEIYYLDPLLADLPDRNERQLPISIFDAELDDASFDYVVSIDFLEHIEESKREPFIKRASSLARHGIVLACPCREGGHAELVDREILEGYERATGQPYPWLADHVNFGLPSSAALRKMLEEEGFEIAVRGNGHVPFLRDLLLPLLVLWDLDAGKKRAQALSTRFNREFQQYDRVAPSYRELFIASRSPVPSLASSGDGGASSESLSASAKEAWGAFRIEIQDALLSCLEEVGPSLAIAKRECDKRCAASEETARTALAELEQERAERAHEKALLEGAVKQAESERDQSREALEYLQSSRVYRLARSLTRGIDKLRRPFGRSS